jgi:hypothetical protein
MRSGMYKPPLGARPLRTAYREPQESISERGSSGSEEKSN